MKMLQKFLQRLYLEESLNIFARNWVFFQHLDSDDIQVHTFHFWEVCYTECVAYESFGVNIIRIE